jgi:transporter family-2 protein
VPTPSIVFVVLAVLAGVAVGFQAIANARLGEATGSPFGAAFISFVVGTLILAAIVAVRGDRVWPATPVAWWSWIGGALGAFFIVTAVAAVPRIGPTMLFLAAILGQVTTGFVVERTGAFGVERTTVTAWQLLGYALVLAGFVLVRSR